MENTSTSPPEIALTEEVLTESPLELFTAWFDLAQKHSGFLDPNAMCLSTVDVDGYPDSRMVLLKNYNAQGFVFFTNSLSRKGQALSATPKAALNFYWDPLGIQIRIQGEVEVVSAEARSACFKTERVIEQT
jgi:pyridoxamine 5'-phosphate oxidase